ncbi:MAG: YicC/YloC family endoribonuclease [Sumerlaeia bacterium]
MRSMTGFGRETAEGPLGSVTVELRSVNHRFLEIAVRAPSALAALEPELRARIKERLVRGRVDATVRFTPAGDTTGDAPAVRLNIALVRSLAEQFRKALGTAEGSVRAAELLSVPGVLETGDAEAPTEESLAALGAILREALDGALDGLIAERTREGAALREALAAMAADMRGHAAAVSDGRDAVVDRYRERLQARLEKLLGPEGPALDPGRLEQEVLFFADKADISEECARLAAHLDALDAGIAADDEAVGRNLEFLTQEILREVNTTGSKCRDLDIGRHAMALKQLVESLKEQLANVE